MNDKSDQELLADLGITAEKKAKTSRTLKEARIVAGFEDIQRFVEEQGRHPGHGPELDIFERLYAVRLDRLRAQSACVDLLTDLDYQKLLDSKKKIDVDALDDE